MKACESRDRMKKQISKNGIEPTSKTFEQYRRYRNTLTTIIRRQKKIFYEKEFNKHRTDIKKTMSTLNELVRKSNDKHAVLTHKFLDEGKWIEDKTKVVEGFNKFYASVGPNTMNKLKHQLRLLKNI
jgi:hypothetical protein